MSILDKVYTTFKRLDQDFARSKKTRTEFITDKFGGDIAIGSVIILDAIRAEGVEESPENIEKMSYVKDTFVRIQACANHLDSLTSFSFADTNTVSSFVDILGHAENHGSGQSEVNQAELWKGRPQALHYVCTPDEARFANPDNCTVFQAFNENMAGLIVGCFKPDRELQLAGYYRVLPGRRVKSIQVGAVAKNLK